MRSVRALIAVTGLAILLAACAWVKLTPGGAKTRVLAATEVASCRKIGQTTAYVRDEIGGVYRNADKVRADMEALARNTAAEMGGDTVVPAGEPQDGKQTFDVYRCVGP